MTCQSEREQQKTATARRSIYAPVRLDLIGGWSDQADWETLGEPGAVLSVSAGWLHGDLGLRFPSAPSHVLAIDELELVHSRVSGVGTGLGISSTLHALRYLQVHPESDWREWTEASVAAEANGTRGGWQDAPSALLPGMKLLTKIPGRPLQVEYLPNYPLLDHLVLFDTGIRRNSGEIGAKIRTLMTGSDAGLGMHWQQFREVLREAVVFAKIVARSEGISPSGIWGSACVRNWEKLTRYVPEMLSPVKLPMLDRSAYGYKLLGAGGGGDGVYFARDPDCRAKIVKELRDVGFWAVIPEVLQGYRWGIGE